jgi:hypothetical protein
MWQLAETFCYRLEDAAPPEGEGWEPVSALVQGYRIVIIWRRWTGETPRILDPAEVHAVLFGKR